MATETLDRIRAVVMKLPETERAELAHDLVVSLDEPRESEIEEAWDQEILHRKALIDSGQAVLLDSEEFIQKLRTR